jgi:hypothetical protein
MFIELDVQRSFDSQLSQHLPEFTEGRLVPEFTEGRLGLNVLGCSLG